MRTKPKGFYRTPNEEEMKVKHKQLNLSIPYSPEFIKDICNVMSWEDEKEKAFTKEEDWELNLQSERTFEREQERERKINYNRNVQQFLNTLNYNQVGGKSPLEKAFNIVAGLSSMKGGKNESKKGEESMPIFEPGNEAGKTANTLQERMEMTKKIKAASKFTQKATNVDEDDLEGVALSKLNEFEINVLDALGYISTFARLEASRRVTREKDPTSNVKRMVRMDSYSQLSKVSKVNFVLPTYKVKLANKDFSIEEGVKKKYSKQALVLLIDDSGSMHTIEKMSKVRAIVVNRMEQVAKGNAELYINTFETELDPFWEIMRTEEECIDFLSRYNKFFRFSRGGTDMQKAISSTEDMINAKQFPTKKGIFELTTERPEICIMNDGQDHVDDNYTPRYPTHGFIIEGSHEGMKNFCQRSGGIYREFN